MQKVEKLILALTAAVIVASVGYFAGVRSTADPYRVEVQYAVAESDQVLILETPTPTPEATQPLLVNINTATAEQLQQLPGIGEKRAQDIVADRTANGPFRIVEDITRVSGIGEGTLAGIIEHITVD